MLMSSTAGFSGRGAQLNLPSKPGIKYFMALRDRLCCVHGLAHKTLEDAGLKLRHAYDTRSRGRDFAMGVKVWVYSPVQEKGLNEAQYVGLCVVLGTFV